MHEWLMFEPKMEGEQNIKIILGCLALL